MARLTLILAALLLSGCRWFIREVPVEVEVERTVYVQVSTVPEPPPELLAPILRPDFLFVSPGDPTAPSALTPMGEAALRTWVQDLESMVDAWRAWGHNERHELPSEPQTR